MDFNSDMGDIIEINATGFDANSNNLNLDLEEYDDSDAWYNDDDIVSPKEGRRRMVYYPGPRRGALVCHLGRCCKPV